MNGVSVTKFADSSKTEVFLHQIAQAVNNIERQLSALPIYFGNTDPNGVLNADIGSIYCRLGLQGKNEQETTPKFYLKTKSGVKGWLALIYTGSEASSAVNASQTSLYFYLPETGNAELYYKQSDDATPTGWKTL